MYLTGVRIIERATHVRRERTHTLRGRGTEPTHRERDREREREIKRKRERERKLTHMAYFMTNRKGEGGR